MYLINNDVTRQVLTMELTIDALEQAYREHVSGHSVCRPRIDIRIPNKDPAKVYRWGTMEGGSMSGYFAIRMKSDITYERSYNGVLSEEKYCVEPGTFCGLILLFSTDNGQPLALLNDGVLQQMRVGADGGIGVKYAARGDAEVIGMLGAGGQARSHLRAYMTVRPNLKKLKVFSPTPANREKYAQEARELYGLETEICDSPEQVYRGADIVASITDSAVPVLDGACIEKGQHIVNVGGGGIAPPSVLEKVDVYLRFGDAPAPWGLPELDLSDEYITYAAEPKGVDTKRMKSYGKRGHGVALPDRMVTLSDVFNGSGSARTSDDQVTYSERGNLQGQQFWSVAGRVYEKVREQGLGQALPDEWFTQDIRN